MNLKNFPIPGRLNICIALLQLSLLLAILWSASRIHHWLWLALLVFGYAIVMNSAYAMLHEAEHNILHPTPWINELIGVTLALFFPAPFHLIRQGHLGHHIRNRSDDEAFDFYFPGENRVWKFVQLYGTLIGLFWVTIFFGNIITLFRPSLFQAKYVEFNRATSAFVDSLNPKYRRLIQLESLLIVVLHSAMIICWGIPLLHYLAIMFGFGFIWSALQYSHHFETVRDVQKGARNLRTFPWLDVVWLNHNWHLNHHMSPTVPWVYLPFIYSGSEYSRSGLFKAYLRMWKGPRLTEERIQNHYAGKIIR